MIHCCNNRHQESQKLLSPWCPTKNHTGDLIFHIVESNKAGPMLTFIRVEEEKKRGGRRPPGPPHLEIQHHRHQIHPAARLPPHLAMELTLFFSIIPCRSRWRRGESLPCRRVLPPPCIPVVSSRQLTHGQRWDGEDRLGRSRWRRGESLPCRRVLPPPHIPVVSTRRAGGGR